MCALNFNIILIFILQICHSIIMISHQTVGISTFITIYWISREPFQERTPPHIMSGCLNLLTCLLGEVKQGVLGSRVHSCLSKHTPVSLWGWRESSAAELEKTQLKLSLISIPLTTIPPWEISSV